MLLIKGIWQLIGFMCKNKAFQGQLSTECIIHTIPRVSEVVERTRSFGEHTHHFQRAENPTEAKRTL